MSCQACGLPLGEQDRSCSTCGHSVSVENMPLLHTQTPNMEPPIEKGESSALQIEESFVGKKHAYYRKKWNKLENRKIKLSWN